MARFNPRFNPRFNFGRAPRRATMPQQARSFTFLQAIGKAKKIAGVIPRIKISPKGVIQPRKPSGVRKI